MSMFNFGKTKLPVLVRKPGNNENYKSLTTATDESPKANGKKGVSSNGTALKKLCLDMREEDILRRLEVARAKQRAVRIQHGLPPAPVELPPINGSPTASAGRTSPSILGSDSNGSRRNSNDSDTDIVATKRQESNSPAPR